MKKFCKVLIVCLIFFGCSSNDDSNQLKSICAVNDPIVDLVWLKTEIEQREQNITDFSKYQYISQSIHNGESVIIDANCDPLANSVFIVFNCKGENIGFIGDENFPFEVLTNSQVIWKTKILFVTSNSSELFSLQLPLKTFLVLFFGVRL